MSEKIFDHEVLMISADGDRSWAKELFEIFINDTADRIEKMEFLLNGDDITAISRHIHTIKGSAGCIGAQSVRKFASEMEIVFKSGDCREFKSMIILLKSEMKMLLQAFERDFGKIPE